MERRIDGSYEERREIRSLRVATGTLACSHCDAPVVLGAPVEPADWIGCPFCLHTGPTRDFLSLTPPTRPARVIVRVRLPD
jgi:hypothetical protein